MGLGQGQAVAMCLSPKSSLYIVRCEWVDCETRRPGWYQFLASLGGGFPQLRFVAAPIELMTMQGSQNADIITTFIRSLAARFIQVCALSREQMCNPKKSA